MHLQYQIKDCLERNVTKISDVKKNAAKKKNLLKTKTLLIYDPLISKALQKTIDKAEIKKYHGYKFKVLDFDEADKLIAEKHKDYVYIWVVPAGASKRNRKPLYNYFIKWQVPPPTFAVGQQATKKVDISVGFFEAWWIFTE